MVVCDEEFRNFTDQSFVLEGRRKVREKGQSCQDKLHDLYNFSPKEVKEFSLLF